MAKRKKPKHSWGELLFLQHLHDKKLQGWTHELKFHKERKWRFDFACPDLFIAVEIEGGTHVQGRHSRGAGFENDCIKYYEAMCLGWWVYRCTTQMVMRGDAIEHVCNLVQKREQQRA